MDKLNSAYYFLNFILKNEPIHVPVIKFGVYMYIYIHAAVSVSINIPFNFYFLYSCLTAEHNSTKLHPSTYTKVSVYLAF